MEDDRMQYGMKPHEESTLTFVNENVIVAERIEQTDVGQQILGDSLRRALQTLWEELGGLHKLFCQHAYLLHRRHPSSSILSHRAIR